MPIKIIKHNKNKRSLHNPHDKLLFATMRNRRIAKDAAQEYLPPELLPSLNLDKMQMYKSKLVSPQMKEFNADIIYQIPFKDTKAFLLFHCEQESNPKRTISLKIWQYLFLILMEYAENHPNDPLPVPLPILLYTGEAKFTKTTNFFDLFGEHKALAESTVLQPIKVIDVCRLNDDDIKKHKLFGLSEFAFKHKKSSDFEGFLKVALPWFCKIEAQVGDDYGKIFINYIIEVFSQSDCKVFEKIAKEILSNELGEETMTIAEQWVHKGMQQGIQQGMQQGIQRGVQQGIQREKYFIAKNLLMKNLDEEFIAETTGLSFNEIEKLKKEQSSQNGSPE